MATSEDRTIAAKYAVSPSSSLANDGYAKRVVELPAPGTVRITVELTANRAPTSSRARDRAHAEGVLGIGLLGGMQILSCAVVVEWHWAATRSVSEISQSVSS